MNIARVLSPHSARDHRRNGARRQPPLYLVISWTGVVEHIALRLDLLYHTETISIEAELSTGSSPHVVVGLVIRSRVVYAESGSMDLSQFAAALNHAATFPLVAGLMLVLTGVGFKLAVVPFHMWTPDVYEGAPLPVTAFIATVSKGGMFALILRWLHLHDAGLTGTTGLVLSIIAIASMLKGNLLALTQTSVKRILAYSSIAHMGYALVALLAGGAIGAPAATYYLAAYFATILRAFVMTILSVQIAKLPHRRLRTLLAQTNPRSSFYSLLLSLAESANRGFPASSSLPPVLTSLDGFLFARRQRPSACLHLRILAAMYIKSSDTTDSRQLCRHRQQ